MKNNLLLLWIVWFPFASLLAQTHPVEQCGTAFLKAQLPKDRTDAQSFGKEKTDGQVSIAGVSTIPVVVHVIQRAGTSEGVSDAAVQATIQSLSNDFRKLNADWSKTQSAYLNRVADCEIEFCLAKVDPLGQATTGINRVVSNRGAIWGMDESVKTKAGGGADAWDHTRYLNIWVCAVVDPQASGDVTVAYTRGVEYFPYNPNFDGIVIDFSKFNAGARTITHETGHWLGLDHLWGTDANNDLLCLIGDDGVTDTPKQKGPNQDCPQTPVFSCPASSESDMYENYMDYSACRCMFTAGQKSKMQQVLQGSRASMLSANNLTTCTGNPVSETCDVPQNLSFSNISETSTVLSWGIVANAKAYKVEYKKKSDVSWTGYVSLTNTVTISNLLPATNYEFKVSTGCNISQSAFSQIKEFTTLGSQACATPQTPQIIYLTENMAILSWDNFDINARYEVSVKKQSATQWTVLTTQNNTVKIENLEPNTSYAFKVRRYCSSQISAYCPDIEIKTKVSDGTCADNYEPNNTAQTAMKIPLNKWITSKIYTSEENDFYYVDLPDKGMFNVYLTQPFDVDLEVDGATSAHTVFDGNEYIENPDANAKRYNIKVNGFTRFNYDVNKCYKLIAQACGTVANRSIKNVTETSARLEWEPLNYGDYYEVVYWKGNVSFNQAAIKYYLYTKASFANLSNLLPGTTYSFNIRAICGDVSGYYLYYSSGFQTLTQNQCGHVTSLYASQIGANSIVANWSKIGTPTGYRVFYKESSATQWLTLETTGSSISLSALKANTTYLINVTAKCTNGLSNTQQISVKTSAVSQACASFQFDPNPTSTGIYYPCDTRPYTAPVLGGTAPYQYQWSNGSTATFIPGTQPGTYTVTVTDANACTVGKTITVPLVEKPTVTLTVVQKASSCTASGGEITASVAKGKAPYTYKWSNGQSGTKIVNVLPGIYALTATDNNGCTASAQVELQKADKLQAGISTLPAGCGNTGQATALATGGVAPYQYRWSHGPLTATVQGLAVGTYTVTITDAQSCQTSATAVVGGAANNLQISFTVKDYLCDNSKGTVAANVTGGTQPYTYKWSNGATGQSINNLLGGTYTVTVTAQNSCVSIKSAVVQNGICVSVYDPVCGADGKEYANSCEAECAGVAWTPGPCGCKCTSASAEPICEDFQSYLTSSPSADGIGIIGPQSACWTTWTGVEGGSEDGTVRHLTDGRKYLRIQGVNTTGGPQDVVMLLGNRTVGSYQLKFKFLIYPQDKGYFNVLNTFTPGASNGNQWAEEVYFSGNGAGYLKVSGQSNVNFTYTSTANSVWIDIVQDFDLQTGLTKLTIDGSLVHQWVMAVKRLSALNFYPVNNTYRFFIDDITLTKQSTDLIAYYPFNGNANDVSGNNLNGTVYGAQLTTDKFGKANSAYQFNGVNQYISVADNALLDIGASDYTLTAWIKTSTQNVGRIVSKGSSNCSTGYMMRTGGSNASKVHLENAALSACRVNYFGNATINDGQWHCVAGVVQRNASAAIYVDGTLDRQIAVNTANLDFSNALNLTIGVSHVAGLPEWFNGSIDEVRLYSKVLTAQEIAGLCPSSKPFGLRDATALSSSGGAYLKVYPNPSSSSSMLEVAYNAVSLENERVRIAITDLIGKVVLEQAEMAVEGLNKYALSLPASLDGIYILHLSNGQHLYSEKLILLK